MENSERWRSIQEIFQQARELAPEQRSAYLDSACKEDASLRSEVDSLLRSSEEAGNFLESYADGPSSKTQSISAVDPWIGKQVGPYKIIERIAFGGMSVVYHAEDVKLGRGAAVKFLSVQLQRDAQARERFGREARAASALNHPNICTIYGVGEFEEHPYLAMELLKGQILSNLIREKTLPVERILELAIPIMSALEAAHGEGIIHRDLKPANIFVTDKGQVKVLDFGLAKQTVVGAALGETTMAADQSPEPDTLTSPGMVLGTVSYMSPEQTRGERLDARSDLFSLGAVLYEMATGQRAFPGRLPILICDAILNRPPAPLREANPLIPARLEAIITKALQKNRGQRYQTAAEFLTDLRALRDELKSGSRPPMPLPPSGRQIARWIAPALLLLIVLGAAGASWWKSRRASPLSSNAASGTTALSISRPAVAVLGFENLTGRPEHAWLSTAFSEMLSTELAAGGRLRVVPGENVARARKELGLGGSNSYSKETLNRIRKNLGVDYVVMGSYFDAGKEAGSEVRVDVRLQDVRSGEVIVLVPQTGTESRLIELLSNSGADLRARLRIGDVDGAEVTKVAATVPKDATAARLYSEGLAKLRDLDTTSARDSLQRAAAVEPDHPLIHAALAEVWSQLGYDEKSRVEARLAASLSGQLPQSDQLWVEGRFRESTQEWDKAIDVYRTLLGLYPDNIEYGLRLAAVQTTAGKQKDALQTIATLRKLPPPANSDPRIDLAEADAAEISADFRHEKEVATRALEESRSRGARLLSARAQYAAAWAALNLGEMNDAAKSAEEARATYISAGDRNGEANMLRTLGTVHLMQGDLNGAMSYYQNALRLARQVGNRYSEAAALNQMATTMERQGNHDAALDSYQKALVIVREVGNKLAEATAVNNIANILWARGDLNGARRMYEQAATIAQQLGDRGREAGSTVNIAHILFQQGDLKGAQDKIEHALPLARDIGEQSILGEASNSYGDIRAAQADFSGARQHYQESLAAREKLGEQLGLAETRMSMAELLLAEGQPSEAEKLLRVALDEFQKEGSQDDGIVATGLLASALLNLGKIGEARATVDRVMARAEKIENPYVRSNFLVEASRVDAFSGRPAEAQAMVNSALQTATQFGFLNTQLKARLARGEIERKIGDAGKAHIELATLQQDADYHGFIAIARKAASLSNN